MAKLPGPKTVKAGTAAEAKTKKVAAAPVEASEVEETEEEEVEEETEEEAEEKPAKKSKTDAVSVINPSLDKASKRKARELIDAGKVLVGDESADFINTMYEEMLGEEEGENLPEIVIDGVPNKLPVRHEVIDVKGKKVNYPIFFVAAVKGGFCMYNELGMRVSAVTKNTDEEKDAVSKLNKACARFNAQRKATRLPDELMKGM